MFVLPYVYFCILKKIHICFIIEYFGYISKLKHSKYDDSTFLKPNHAYMKTPRLCVSPSMCTTDYTAYEDGDHTLSRAYP